MTTQSVKDMTGRRSSAVNGIEITALMSGVDPASGAAELAAVSADAGSLGTALTQALSAGPVTMLAPTLSAGSAAFSCAAGFMMNTLTEACCPTQASLPASGAEPQRIMWKTSCTWECLSPYILYASACHTCSEYNALLASAAPTKPINSSWDDSGASSDCTAWKCSPGLLSQADRPACVPFAVLQSSCAVYTRCATCSISADCVWCPTLGGCVPGRVNTANKTGCRFQDGSGRTRCDCEMAGCPLECVGNGCTSCLQDGLCGWCGGQGSCQLDLTSLPTRAAAAILSAGPSKSCPSGWLSMDAVMQISGGVSAVCPSAQAGTMWIVALVSTCVCTVVVGMLCIHLLFKLNVLTPTILGYGPRPPTSVPARVLERIPAFKYTGRRQPEMPEISEVTDTEMDEGIIDEGTCPICLAEYNEGDELRMLGCLHVYHSHCIMQWFAVSSECPLCKRDVSAAVAAANPSDLTGAAFAARQGRNYYAAADILDRRRRQPSRRCRCLPFGSPGWREGLSQQTPSPATRPEPVPDALSSSTRQVQDDLPNDSISIHGSSAIASLVIVSRDPNIGLLPDSNAVSGFSAPEYLNAPIQANVGGSDADGGTGAQPEESMVEGHSATATAVGESVEFSLSESAHQNRPYQWDVHFPSEEEESEYCGGYAIDMPALLTEPSAPPPAEAVDREESWTDNGLRH